MFSWFARGGDGRADALSCEELGRPDLPWRESEDRVARRKDGRGRARAGLLSALVAAGASSWLLGACGETKLTSIERPPGPTPCLPGEPTPCPDPGEPAPCPDPADPAACPEPESPGSCPEHGDLPVIGDFMVSDGTQFWLRQSPTAKTLTIVPAGPPAPSRPPEVYWARRFCPGWILMSDHDGVLARLDLASASDRALLCLRPVPDEATAARLGSPDVSDLAAGCGGAPWIEAVAR